MEKLTACNVEKRLDVSEMYIALSNDEPIVIVYHNEKWWNLSKNTVVDDINQLQYVEPLEKYYIHGVYKTHEAIYIIELDLDLYKEKIEK